jgi:hypothetical protein
MIADVLEHFFSFDGRVGIVTDASSGIRLGIAHLLADTGAKSKMSQATAPVLSKQLRNIGAKYQGALVTHDSDVSLPQSRHKTSYSRADIDKHTTYRIIRASLQSPGSPCSLFFDSRFY